MMKKIFCLLVSTLFLMSALCAQNTKDTGSSAGGYPIGTSDQPVYIDEYFMFLIDSGAPHLEATLPRVQAKFIGETMPIAVSGNPGACTFLITQEVWSSNQLIESVPTQEAQTLFNAWRQNPTSEELFTYLDNQVKASRGVVSLGEASRCKAAALAIKERYPSACLFNGMTVFDTADWIALNYSNNLLYFFVTESGKAVFTIPGTQMLNLEQSRERGMYENTKKGQVTFLPGPHRPNCIQYN